MITVPFSQVRRPEEQVKFQTLLSDTELRNLQKVLSEAVAAATI